MTTVAADIYLRLSDLSKDDRDSFPDREAKLRTEASRLGWSVYRVVIENDVTPDGKRKSASAFKRKEVTLATAAPCSGSTGPVSGRCLTTSWPGGRRRCWARILTGLSATPAILKTLLRL